jgi:hypothetical protein
MSGAAFPPQHDKVERRWHAPSPLARWLANIHNARASGQLGPADQGRSRATVQGIVHFGQSTSMSGKQTMQKPPMQQAQAEGGKLQLSRAKS